MPMAKGTCFGFLSLKLMLILIALIDITIGASAIGIGVIAFLKFNLPLSLMAYVLMNSFCLLLAFGSIWAISTKRLHILRFYYAWKCLEVVLIPIFELTILTLAGKTQLGSSSSINYYIIVLIKAMLRLYFAYLIFSYFMRLDRGESLLVEYGERKLTKMIDLINRDQAKHQWDLELTERNNTRSSNMI